jgi:DNA repair protein RadC
MTHLQSCAVDAVTEPRFFTIQYICFLLIFNLLCLFLNPRRQRMPSDLQAHNLRVSAYRGRVARPNDATCTIDFSITTCIAPEEMILFYRLFLNAGEFGYADGNQHHSRGRGRTMYTDETAARQSQTSQLIAEMPDRERPRERLIHRGADALSDTELLAILLRSGPRGSSVVDLARRLLSSFDGNLAQLAAANLTELCAIHGIGMAKAVEIRAAFTLAARLAETQVLKRPRLESPIEVTTLMREHFRNLKQEEFHALLLDTKHALIRDELVTIGLLDRSQVHAREVFRTAIRESAARILLVHNHPSGDPTPSSQDIACTRELVAAGKLVGITVLDHVVVGHRSPERIKEYVSFREENLL